jgi:hypothetical protein
MWDQVSSLKGEKGQFMPHTSRSLVAPLFFLILVFFAGSAALGQAPASGAAVARLENGQPTMLLGDAELAALLRLEGALLRQSGTLLAVRLEASQGRYYLVGKGETEDGNCFSAANELLAEGGLLTLGPTTHFCHGRRCTDCAFMGDVFTGEILGCTCRDLQGHCDHTIQHQEP